MGQQQSTQHTPAIERLMAVDTKHARGPLLYMVCYKTSPDSYQSYWNVYPADKPEDATRQAERDGLFQHGRLHLWTLPYNKAGMTPEQTYAEHIAKATGA